MHTHLVMQIFIATPLYSRSDSPGDQTYCYRLRPFNPKNIRQKRRRDDDVLEEVEFYLEI